MLCYFYFILFLFYFLVAVVDITVNGITRAQNWSNERRHLLYSDTRSITQKKDITKPCCKVNARNQPSRWSTEQNRHAHPKKKSQKKRNSSARNRTLVSRVTGDDTSHYTTEEEDMRKRTRAMA